MSPLQIKNNPKGKKENQSHKVSEAGNWEKKHKQKEPQYRKRTSNKQKHLDGGRTLCRENSFAPKKAKSFVWQKILPTKFLFLLLPISSYACY